MRIGNPQNADGKDLITGISIVNGSGITASDVVCVSAGENVSFVANDGTMTVSVDLSHVDDTTKVIKPVVKGSAGQVLALNDDGTTKWVKNGIDELPWDSITSKPSMITAFANTAAGAVGSVLQMKNDGVMNFVSYDSSVLASSINAPMGKAVYKLFNEHDSNSKKHIPSVGKAGQVLMKTSIGVAFENLPDQITVDEELTGDSHNPVAGKAIVSALETKITAPSTRNQGGKVLALNDDATKYVWSDVSKSNTANYAVSAGVAAVAQSVQWENVQGAPEFITMQAVDSLPSNDIKDNVIYLVPNGDENTSNVRDEYIFQGNSWELIGTTKMDVDIIENHIANSSVHIPAIDISLEGKVLKIHDGNAQWSDNIISYEVNENTTDAVAGMAVWSHVSSTVKSLDAMTSAVYVYSPGVVNSSYRTVCDNNGNIIHDYYQKKIDENNKLNVSYVVGAALSTHNHSDDEWFASALGTKITPPDKTDNGGKVLALNEEGNGYEWIEVNKVTSSTSAVISDSAVYDGSGNIITEYYQKKINAENLLDGSYISGAVASAVIVNSHTVSADVPENAKFTDTVVSYLNNPVTSISAGEGIEMSYSNGAVTINADAADIVIDNELTAYGVNVVAGSAIYAKIMSVVANAGGGDMLKEEYVNGAGVVKHASMSDRLTNAVYIGNAPFDGTTDLSIKDIGASPVDHNHSEDDWFVENINDVSSHAKISSVHVPNAEGKEGKALVVSGGVPLWDDLPVSINAVRHYNTMPEATENEVAVYDGDTTSEFITGGIYKGVLSSDISIGFSGSYNYNTMSFDVEYEEFKNYSSIVIDEQEYSVYISSGVKKIGSTETENTAYLYPAKENGKYWWVISDKYNQEEISGISDSYTGNLSVTYNANYGDGQGTYTFVNKTGSATGTNRAWYFAGAGEGGDWIGYDDANSRWTLYHTADGSESNWQEVIELRFGTIEGYCATLDGTWSNGAVVTEYKEINTLYSVTSAGDEQFNGIYSACDAPALIDDYRPASKTYTNGKTYLSYYHDDWSDYWYFTVQKDFYVDSEYYNKSGVDPIGSYNVNRNVNRSASDIPTPPPVVSEYIIDDDVDYNIKMLANDDAVKNLETTSVLECKNGTWSGTFDVHYIALWKLISNNEVSSSSDCVISSITVDSAITSDGVNPVVGSAIYSSLSSKVDSSSLATVAFTGKYNDLVGFPLKNDIVVIDELPDEESLIDNQYYLYVGENDNDLRYCDLLVVEDGKLIVVRRLDTSYGNSTLQINISQ